MHLPALAAIARDDHPFVVIQKSAQVGVTELLVNLALWTADTGYAERGNVLFAMPTQNQMDDFAQARFDRALQDSPYLRARLQPEPPLRKGADSKRLKHLGPGWIYLRGADSRRQIASVDADLVVLDEFDQMAEGTLELARKRLASSRRGMLRVASTPRYPEAGVNALFLQSDQRRYFLPCMACGLEQVLAWDANIDSERMLLVCRECREPLDPRVEGRWVATAPGNDRIRGYHLSRLYSPWVNIRELVEASTATTPAALQEFQNSDLGEVFSPPGSGLSLDLLDRCRREYALDEYAGQPCDMGVDVGIKLHVVIREHLFETLFERGGFRQRRSGNLPRLWFAAEVDNFLELGALIKRFHVQRCVIDAQPEVRLAMEFAQRHGDVVTLSYYGRSELGHELARNPNGVRICHANRTQALDEMAGRFQDGNAELPRDARQLGGRIKDGAGDYYRQLLAQQRTVERDSTGNWIARWVDNDKPDHFAHAEVYCLLADVVAEKSRVGFYFL